MSNSSGGDPVTRYISERLRSPFVFFDIGCSGGINRIWRAFDDRLQAHAFDPNVEEIEKLRQSETHKGIDYQEAFVGVPEHHPLAGRIAKRDFVRNSPWSRLSAAVSFNRRLKEMEKLNHRELTDMNAWARMKLTSRPPVYLPEYLRASNLDDLDFVKLDVDGADFFILQTIFESELHPKILGMFLEVNFFGSDEPDHNTFHNTDRLMRKMGFDLFDLSMRTYSSHALPWPYAIGIPAQTVNGRPFQGDALYVRDISSPTMRKTVEDMPVDKIAKCVAIFSLMGHYDQAAEVTEAFANRLSEILDVPQLLEMLAQKIQKPLGTHLSRNDYIAAFDADDPMFYPGWTKERKHRTEPAPTMAAPSASPSRPRRKKSIMKRLKKRIWR
jgi:FkbM family methyltransferase